MLQMNFDLMSKTIKKKSPRERRTSSALQVLGPHQEIKMTKSVCRPPSAMRISNDQMNMECVTEARSQTEHVSEICEVNSNRKKSNLSKRKPYRIADLNQGAFAFRSKDKMEQPIYPLCYVERNLQFFLDFRETRKKE